MAVLILNDARIDVQRTRQNKRGSTTVRRSAAGWWWVSTGALMTHADEQTRKIMALLKAGRADARIAKRLGISRDEVRAAIASVIDAAKLDDEARVADLAQQVGIIRPRD